MDDTISSGRSSDESRTKEIFKVRKGMMAYVKIEERALLSIARLWTLLSSNLLFITMVRFLSETLVLFPIFDFALRERLFTAFVVLSSCEFIRLFEIFRKYLYTLPFSKKSIRASW